MWRRSWLWLCALAVLAGARPAVGETVVEAWRSPFGAPISVSVNPTDGSVRSALGSSVMHLAANGMVLSQTNGFDRPRSVSVNSRDGSCWAADTYSNQVVHPSASGAELSRGGGFDWPLSVSVNPSDNSCWVTDTYNHQVVHLSAAGAASAVSLPFEDGFEGVAVGDYPDETGWQMMFSGQDAYVSDDVAYSGAHSFRLESLSGWARHDYVQLVEIPDYLTYEACVYVAPGGREEGVVGFLEAFGSQGPAWNKVVVDGQNGYVRFEGVDSTVVDSYTAGTWCVVRVDLDYVALQARVWVNGSIVAEGLAIQPKEFDYPGYGYVVLDKFGLIAGYGPDTTAVVYFDDVAAYETPRILTSITTVGLQNSGTSTFYLRNANGPGPADLTFRYGPAASDWMPIAGDWDGDGDVTIGLYNPTTGYFYLRNSNSAGVADLAFRYGPTGSTLKPIAGDWDGDGDVTIGLYNPTTGYFYLRNTNAPGPADLTFRFGPAGSGWIPIVGSWDGDSTDTIGLYNPTTGTFYLRNTNAAGAADLTFRYGPTASAWLPIAGDWNGDETDTIGLFSAGASTFYLRNSNSAGVADLTFRYGPKPSTWLPIAGDWDGQ